MLSGAASVFAQGNSGNRPGGSGRPTSNPGSSRGMETQRSGSGRRMDDGFGRTSAPSKSRSQNRTKDRKYVDGIPTETELRRFGGVARKLDTTPEALRDSFEAARKMNPDLNFGQFVAANVVADNLGSRHPQITASAILFGLENGDSLGRTLRNLGLPKDEAKRAEKDAKRKIEKSREEFDN